MAQRVLAEHRCGGVVNRIEPAEVEVAGQHFRRRDGQVGGFPTLLVVPLIAEEPERLVLAVVYAGDVDGPAHGAGNLVIGEGIVARQLFQPGAVDQGLLDVAVLAGAVPLVGAALEDRGQQPAGRVAEFGRHAGSEELDLLQRVDGGGGDLVGGPDDGPDRFLAAHTVHGVADGALPLPYHVLPVDVRGGRKIQQDAEGVLLQNRNLDDRLPLQDLAGGGRLGFEQRGRPGDVDRLGDRPHFQGGVDARLFAGAQRHTVADIPLEALRLDGEPVRPGVEIGHVVVALGRSESLVDKLGLVVDQADGGVWNHGAGVVRDGADYGSGTGGLRQGNRHEQ